jgi:hypothetical protein
MEGILNLVWLTIALAAFVRLHLWARLEPDHRRVAFVAVATVCGLALLFPIVSISDDLQETVAALEDHVALRRLIASTAHVIAISVATVLVPDICLAVAALEVADEKCLALTSFAGAPIFERRGPPSTAC